MPVKPSDIAPLISKTTQERNEMHQFALTAELPAFEPPNAWRRLYVKDIYLRFREVGESHEQALSDTIAALPDLQFDRNGTVIYNQKSRPQV